ncbi:MAG: TspO/MBR family protein [Hominenteromicrobium sp.]
MKKQNVYGYLIGIGIAELAGLLARLVSGAGDPFYEKLNQPPLAPPGWGFPVVWAILYALMGAASYQVYGSRSELRRSALVLYAVQLAVNFFWTLVFFRFRALGAAAAVLILLIVLVAMTAVWFRRVRPSAGALMLPYLLWVIFALYLNLGVYFLNM